MNFAKLAVSFTGDNSDGIFPVVALEQKSSQMHLKRLLRITICERLSHEAYFELSKLLKMWNIKYVGNSSVDEAICGA